MGKRYLWCLFIILVAAYVVSVFSSPADPQVLSRYHITQTQAQFINTAVVIPLVIIWLAAFSGFWRLHTYAQTVRDTPEGQPFRALAAGLLISVMGLPLSSVITTVLNRYATQHPDMLPTVTITRNYFGVLLALLAFYLIGNGAEALARLVKGRRPHLGHPIWSIGCIIMSSLFVWLIMTHPGDKAYYLPGWLVVSTIAVPYLYVWYRGSVAAYCVYYYQKNTRGTLYQRALSSFSAGLAVVIVSSMFIQFITTFGERINRLNLTPVLAIIYLLLVLWAIGYGLIARGAKKLKTLEDV